MENKKFWTPVRTKSRQEKKLVRYCAINNIPCYLPVIRKNHVYGKREAEFSSPMFPGYVFCSINDSLFSKLQLSNAIVYKIPVDKYAERILKSNNSCESKNSKALLYNIKESNSLEKKI